MNWIEYLLVLAGVGVGVFGIVVLAYWSLNRAYRRDHDNFMKETKRGSPRQ